MLLDGLNAMPVTPERVIPMEGAKNFRDMGGYPGQDGKKVKWGKLFRSSRLSALTENDHTRIAALHLDLVVDFRQRVEREREPSRWGAIPVPRTEPLQIVPGSSDAGLQSANADPSRTVAFMESVYADFVLNQTEAYGHMFAFILEIHDANVLLHCAAGKDRTGFGSALILSSLGVSRRDITEDYLLTGRCLDTDHEMDNVLRVAPELFRPPNTRESIRPMFETRGAYLETAFRTMEADAGSVDAYLERRMGLGSRELETLRNRYLV